MLTNLSHWGAFDARVSNGRVVEARPRAEDPHPSPMIRSIPDAVHAKCRIEQPMVRKGWLERRTESDRTARGADPFVPVGWDVATRLVAQELSRIKETFGNQAIFNGAAGWASAGCFHHARTQLRRLLNLHGGHTFHKGNYSFGAAVILLPHIVGTTQPLFGPSTDWRSVAAEGELVVCFGGISLKNLQVESGGVGAHTVFEALRAVRQAGIEFIGITPLHQDLPPFLDAEWIPVRPNTDTALMLALAQTIAADGLHDRAFLDRYTVGFGAFLHYLNGASDGIPKTPEWAGPICDVPPDRIRRLARKMAARRTFITVSWSIQRGDHGEQPYWAAIALASMLGRIGLPGGGVGFGFGSEHKQGNPTSAIRPPRFPAGRNPVETYIPASRWSDALLNPGAPVDFDGQRLIFPDIRLLHLCGSNPFHHQPDSNRVIAALHRPETIIVHEPWWTPMARMADIVLPSTTTVERNDLGNGELDRFLIAMKQAIAPVGQARNDHDVLADVADALGFRSAFTEGLDENGWLRRMYQELRRDCAASGFEMPDFDTFWHTGMLQFPSLPEPCVEFADFRRDPDSSPLRTPSGRIEIFSETIAAFGYDDCPGHPTWIEPSEWLGQSGLPFQLHLLSHQPTARLHSQLDMGRESLASKVAGREPILIHPVDAASRGIADGDVVRVFNDRGHCLAGARVTEAIRPDVVCIATGAWFDPTVWGAPGALDKHGNVNMLTLDKGTSKLAQGPSAQTALVEVERWTGPLPAITAHVPPARWNE